MYDDIFTGTDSDYKKIEQLKKDKKYVFATCYDVDWGFILPCKSGVVFEQQTDGVCCHHIYIEGVLIPLGRVIDISKEPFVNLVSLISDLNYDAKPTKDIWQKVKDCSHIDFEFISAPKGMPCNEEAFQWILYHGHEEGWGQSFNIDGWKEKPIVLVYPNCD